MGRAEAGERGTGDGRPSVPRPPPFDLPPAVHGFVSTREAAQTLGCNVRTVRRAIERGELTARKVGLAYRIAVDDLWSFEAGRERALPAAPARLAALPAIRHAPALPEPLSSFVGRDDDLASVLALLRAPATRMVTLTGPGGIGKTRLALAAAAAMREHFPDGVLFVPLAAISRPELVIPAICQALGLRETASHNWRTRLLSFLVPKRMLLVIDNVEHLLEAAPDLTWILTNAPRVALLATSRAPLRVDGEREVPVAPLSLPEPMAAAIDLLASGASRLFIERSRARDPGFTVDAETASLIADICTRLEGLPLAIELVAAQVKALPPRTLRDRLERRLPLLTGGARDAPLRHRTMRDAIGWSYELLEPDEQALFRRLAVFAGGFTLEAAEAVSRGVEGPDSSSLPPYQPATPSPVLESIASLIDQSLLTRESGPEGEPRYRMLETIREYGLERLEAADVDRGEAEAARAAHARYLLAFARGLRPLANTQATRVPFARLAAEDANVRAALGWLDERGPEADFIGLVVSCWVYWYATGHVRDAEGWLNRALAKSDAAPLPDRARLAIAMAELLMVQGETARAAAVFAEGLALMGEVNDPFDLAMALKSRGALANIMGEFRAAEQYFNETLRLVPAITDAQLRAAVHGELLGNLSVAARGLGQPERATSLIEEELRLVAGRGLELIETRSQIDLAAIARQVGDYRLMAAQLGQCLGRLSERDEPRVIAEALSGMAIVAAAEGQQQAALRLFAAAAALRERADVGMMTPDDIAIHQTLLRQLRDLLGGEDFAAGWDEGQALPVTEAIAVAAAVARQASVPGAAHADRATAITLTRREEEVLRLLAAGQTDRLIAEALFLSPRTVSWHVSAILGKLQATTRREAVARARTVGLL